MKRIWIRRRGAFAPQRRASAETCGRSKGRAKKTPGRLCLLVLVLTTGVSRAGWATPPVPAAPTDVDLPLATRATAAPESSERIHHATGLELFEEGRYEDAVSEFRKAYELEARPEFLFDIARSYDRLGQSDKALYFFKRYLSTAPPDASHRSEAEAFVVRAEPPVTYPLPPSPAPSGPPLFVNDVAGKEPSPLWARWWVWVAAGALVATGLGVGILLSGEDQAGPPASDLGNQRFF